MTEKEAIEKFKNVALTFDFYYKYSFTFSGELDGYKISASFGGNGDDIYRTEVSNNETKVLGDEFDYDWNTVSISKDGSTVFSWDDY